MSEEPTKPEDQAAAEQFDAEAAQAAERVLSDGNPEYTVHHPNAVTDKAKAEDMAYASKYSEEQVVDNANNALKYAKVEEAPDAEHDDIHTDLSPGQYRDMFLQRAQEARVDADKKAQQAADSYDSVYGQSQTAYEQVQALKSGRSIPELQDQISKEKKSRSGFGGSM